MTDDRKKSRPLDVTKPPAKDGTGSGTESGNFQFADGDAEVSWMRRAANAGLRYTRTISEKSGMRILPVLELSAEDEEGPSGPKLKAQPQAETAPPQKAKSPPTPAAKSTPTPATKSAFGPSEKTMFKTAINQFLTAEVQRPQSQVRFRNAGVDMDAPSPAMVWLKRLFVVTALGGIGFGAFYAMRHSKLGNVSDKVRTKELEEQLEIDAPAVREPPAKRPRKRP